MSQENETKTPPSLDGERGAGITSVARNNGGVSIGKALIVAGITIAALFALFTTWDGSEVKEEEQNRRTSLGDTIPFTPARPESDLKQEQVETTQIVEKQPAQPVIEEDKMLAASMRAPVIAFSGSRNATASRNDDDSQNSASQFEIPGGLPGQQPNADRLASKLQPTPIEGVRASVIANLHMTVPQGTMIPCVLQTAVSSDQPGFVSCTVQRDVMAASGQVVLMEKGTHVVGEYEGGMRSGQKRIFVLWNRARTPRGVIVSLASPATDAVGRSGFDGKIDTHFWARFGGAMLMSIVADGSAYAFGRLNDGVDIDTGNTEDASQSAAEIALENSINIQQTLYKNQGDVVSLFVARDLDFSTVYALKTRETSTRILDRTVTGDMRRYDPFVSK